MTSVGRNVVLSTLGSLTSQVVRAGQQLIWVPLFLAAFGPEGYGEWLTLFGLAGYAAMSDLGVQVYWLNSLAGAHVRGEVETYRRIFRGGLMLFAAVGGLTFLAGGLFAVFGGPTALLGLTTLSRGTASGVFLILVFTTLLTVMSGMVRGTFRTAGQNPKVVWFGVAQESIMLMVISAALLFGTRPWGLAWVYAGITSGIAFWVVLDVRRRFPELVDFRVYRADRHTVTILIGGGSLQLVGVLANLLLAQGTLVLTNQGLGAAAVAVIATTRTIANLVRQAAGSVYLATLPEFSRLHAVGDKAAMAQLLRRSMLVVVAVSGIACILLLGLGPILFDVWTAGRFSDAVPLICLFAISVVVDALRMPLHDFLLGCNRVGWAALADITYATFSLAFMWLFFPSMGLWAVPIAMMVCGAAIHLPTVVAGSIQVLGRKFVGRLLGETTLGVTILTVAAAPVALASLVGSRLAIVIAITAASLGVAGLLAWLVLLRRGDVATVRALAATLLGQGER